jgi:uncharacterized protein with HEPN domain
MRNRLVHAYFDVDRGILWETLQSEMPGLKARLSAVLDAFDKGSGDQDGSADS